MEARSAARSVRFLITQDFTTELLAYERSPYGELIKDSRDKSAFIPSPNRSLSPSVFSAVNHRV